MTVNSLPPQAYTRETLQKAYTWLLNQNPNVKDLATNQEILVSLYLRALRNGEVQVDSPSVQNFKKELKSLATLMGDLQTPGAAALQASLQKAPVVATAAPVTAPAASPVAAPVTAKPTEAAPTVASTAPELTDSLDEQSMMAIHEVRLMLNLGSDAEALRALISLGHRQFKKI